MTPDPHDYTIRIITTADEHTFDADGKVEEKVRVTFRVGADGPFVRRFPKESFTGYGALTQLQDFARELRQLRGE